MATSEGSSWPSYAHQVVNCVAVTFLITKCYCVFFPRASDTKSTNSRERIAIARPSWWRYSSDDHWTVSEQV